MAVEIKIDGETLIVNSPYNPAFPPLARHLGGSWNRALKGWAFKASEETLVRELCIEVYGADGPLPPSELVTLRVGVMRRWKDRSDLFFGGRCVASAFSCDEGENAKTGKGVKVLEGEFKAVEGSRRMIAVGAKGTVFEIRDVPRVKAHAELTEHAAAKDFTVEIIEQGEVDHDALETEKEALLARISQIDSLLDGMKTTKKKKKRTPAKKAPAKEQKPAGPRYCF